MYISNIANQENIIKSGQLLPSNFKKQGYWPDELGLEKNTHLENNEFYFDVFASMWTL